MTFLVILGLIFLFLVGAAITYFVGGFLYLCLAFGELPDWKAKVVASGMGLVTLAGLAIMVTAFVSTVMIF